MTAISTNDVKRATVELDRMRGSLKAWLRFRGMNDLVLAGQAPKVRLPLAHAQRAVRAGRDPLVEQDLADKIEALLSTIMPDANLPNANLSANPNGAVQLAQIAISGQAPASPGPTPQDGIAHPWLWPVLIVGGLLMAVTTAISSAADVAKDKEEKACIAAGACTDYGFWLKAGGVVMLAWFAWRELGVGDVVKSAIRNRKGS